MRSVNQLVVSSIVEHTPGGKINFNDVGITNFIVNSKGSMIVGSSATDLAALTPGTDVSALQILSSQALGARWRFPSAVSVKDTGAIGNGIADDTAAINAAIAASISVYFPPGNYLITSTINIPAFQFLFGTFWTPTITKGANIDMFTMNATSSSLYNLRLEGAGGSFTGRGITINASGVDQVIKDCIITDMNGYCIEFTASEAGARIDCRNLHVSRTTLTNPAIKLPSAAETNGNRYFINCKSSGGVIADTDASANSMFVGCAFVNITMGTNSSKTLISGCRIATLGSALTINGVDHSITGNIIAGAITVAANAARCRVYSNTLIDGGTITDSSAVGSNDANVLDEGELHNAMTWEGSVTDPVIGNGSFTSTITRKGRMVTIDIFILMGTTTTFGSGEWTFQLPSAMDNMRPSHLVLGQALYEDFGNDFYVGIARMINGNNFIQMFADNNGSTVRSTVPYTWNSGDSLRMSLSYYIG